MAVNFGGEGPVNWAGTPGAVRGMGLVAPPFAAAALCLAGVADGCCGFAAGFLFLSCVAMAVEVSVGHMAVGVSVGYTSVGWACGRARGRGALGERPNG